MVETEANAHRAARRLLGALDRRRRGLIVAGTMVLAGFGITAVAVAPLAPDAADLPQRVLTEAVEPSGLEPQLQALAALDFPLTRSTVTRGTDSAEALLQRLGVIDADAAAYLRRDLLARQVLAGRGGKLVQARTDGDGRLLELVARFPSDRAEQRLTHFRRLTMVRGEGAGPWTARLAIVEYDHQTRLASGTIRNTLFGATDEAGLPDAVAAQLAEIFSTEIDLHRELRRGDSFHLIYEALSADGEPVPWNEGAGRVLAAEFVNAGRRHEAFWFAGADGRGAYFGRDGRSRKRTFLASPMEFSRVTSGFAMRMHPIAKTWRAHLGVDYSAPKGTAVRAVADGIVDFAGWQGGYGNVVEVDHGNAHKTLYAHLSRIDVKRGQKVIQGEHVGLVGATGFATGPHLHFEFRVNGQHQDPLVAAKATETQALDATARVAFAAQASMAQRQLDIAESLAGPRARSD